jgi:hypothetical protein
MCKVKPVDFSILKLGLEPVEPTATACEGIRPTVKCVEASASEKERVDALIRATVGAALFSDR